MPRIPNTKPLTYGYLPSALTWEQLVTDCTDGIQPERIVLFFKYLINRSKSVVSTKKGRKRFRGNGVPDIEAFIEIHSNYLKKLFGKEEAAKYKQFLLDKKYIEVKNYSNQAAIATRYRICWDRFHRTLFDPVRFYQKIPVRDKKAYNAERNLYRHRKAESLKRLQPEYQELIRNMESLKVDLVSPNAQALVDTYHLRTSMVAGHDYSYLDFLEAVVGKDIEYYIVDDFGHRFHTVYTTIKKQARELLYFENQPNRLRGLDIVGSQPWLASVVSADAIRAHVPECAQLIPMLEQLQAAPEYAEYRRICCEGDIYLRWIAVLEREIGPYWRDIVDEDDLREFKTKAKSRMPDQRINDPALTNRDAAKVCFYRVIYGYPNATDILHRAFLTEWPNIWTAFKAVKTTRLADSPSDKVYANLSLVMQRLESALMLNIIRKFFEHGINQFVTIYDGVLVLEGQWEEAKALMLGTIAEMGLPLPQIKE